MSVESHLLSGGGGAAAFDPLTSSVIFDEFTWYANNTPAGPFGVVSTGSAGGGVVVPANVTPSLTNRVGVIGFGLGTNSNSTADASFFTDYAICYPGQNSSSILEFGMYTPSTLADVTNDYVIDIGFRSDFATHAQTTNAMAITYDRNISTNWAGYTANAGAPTNVTTANAALAVTANAYWNFRITIMAGSVKFEAAPSGSAYITIGTSISNLPDSTHRPFITGIIYKTSSFALQRIFGMDWMQLTSTLTR